MRWLIKFSLLLLLAASGCSTAPVTREFPPLARSILQPWPGKEGKLVTSRCNYSLSPGVCIHELREFDLSDRKTRIELRELGFFCDVNGKLYRVAQEQPALIFEGYKKAWVFGKTKLDYQELLSMRDRYQFLIDARTVCYSFKNFGLEPLRE